jgi:hypothetical protein
MLDPTSQRFSALHWLSRQSDVKDKNLLAQYFTDIGFILKNSKGIYQENSIFRQWFPDPEKNPIPLIQSRL